MSMEPGRFTIACALHEVVDTLKLRARRLRDTKGYESPPFIGYRPLDALHRIT